MTMNQLDMIETDDDVVLGVDAIDSNPPPPNELPPIEVKAPRAPRAYMPGDGDDGETDPLAMMAAVGARKEATAADIVKPWMENHEFVLVTSVQQLEEIVDQAIQHGKCSLDLETQGLDSRIDYINGKPRTKHQIVGFCLSVTGKVGYYVPVRHKGESASYNLPIEPTEAAIRRLCQSAQPTLTESGAKEDPLASRSIAQKGKCNIYFWHAKFDQEFLYPITGIDYWHPESFEDGMLMFYVIYSNDKNLGLKAKANKELITTLSAEATLKYFPREAARHPGLCQPVSYEMIELKDLFVKGRKIHFDELSPQEALRYACSDAICTFLLCDEKERLDSMYAAKGKYASTYRIEKQVSQVMRAVERYRVHIDKEYVRQLLTEAQTEADEYAKFVQDLAVAKGYPGFDIRSSKKLGDFFFGTAPHCLDITPKPSRNEASGQYKTDADTLEALYESNPENEVLGKLVKFRQIDKVIGTYLNSMLNNCDENDCLRVQFKQTGAPTGRFSAPAGDPEHGYSGVPVHGIPSTYDDKKPKVATSLRKIFKPRDGFTQVKVDYAAEELRIVTNLSGEPVWVKEFLEGTGDLHSITARAFFNKTEVTKQERQVGKCVHPDTLLYTEFGFTPICEVGAFGEDDQFRPLDSDRSVYNGNQLVQVTSTYNGGIKPLVHVVTRMGIVTCTHNHRFLLSNGELKRAGDLLPSDMLASPITRDALDFNYPTLKFQAWDTLPEAFYELSDDHSYFAGLYLGDGCANASTVSISHGDTDKVDFSGRFYKEWQDIIVSACSKIGLKPEPKTDKVYLGSRVLVRYIQEMGLLEGSTKRLRVPSWVMAAGKQAAMHFLGGLMDTDGCVTANACAEFTTKDFVFAGQLAALCRGVGLEFSIEPTFNKTYERYYVRFHFTVDSAYKFKPYMKHTGKVERLRPAEQKGRLIQSNDVRLVLPAGDGPCLDISVNTEDHLYCANGLITHNTSNFALVYGGGAQAIVRACGCTEQEGARRKANFDKAMPVFTGWIKKQHVYVQGNKGVYSAFGRWMAIPEIDDPDRMVQSSAKRYAINYPVQGAGADVMKIALVLLHKEFFKRGWLTPGNEDVRMLLTVHDEIVFEVRHAKMPEVMPVIVEKMTAPSRMLNWKVPLLVEPLIDSTWDAKYNYDLIMHGEVKPAKPDEKLKSYEMRIGDKVYHRVPEWLDGILVPEWMGKVPRPPTAPTAPINSGGSSPPTVAEKPLSFTPPAGKLVDPGIKVYRRVITIITKNSVRSIEQAIVMAKDENGEILHLCDPYGNTLVDSKHHIRVNPISFNMALRERNL